MRYTFLPSNFPPFRLSPVNARWRTICSFVDFGLKKYTTCERAANQSRLRETSLMLKLYFIRTRLLAYFNSQKYLIGAET